VTEDDFQRATFLQQTDSERTGNTPNAEPTDTTPCISNDLQAVEYARPDSIDSGFPPEKQGAGGERNIIATRPPANGRVSVSLELPTGMTAVQAQQVLNLHAAGQNGGGK
jgi:hypothetical protein